MPCTTVGRHFSRLSSRSLFSSTPQPIKCTVITPFVEEPDDRFTIELKATSSGSCLLVLACNQLGVATQYHRLFGLSYSKCPGCAGAECLTTKNASSPCCGSNRPTSRRLRSQSQQPVAVSNGHDHHQFNLLCGTEFWLDLDKRVSSQQCCCSSDHRRRLAFHILLRFLPLDLDLLVNCKQTRRLACQQLRHQLTSSHCLSASFYPLAKLLALHAHFNDRLDAITNVDESHSNNNIEEVTSSLTGCYTAYDSQSQHGNEVISPPIASSSLLASIGCSLATIDSDSSYDDAGRHTHQQLSLKDCTPVFGLQHTQLSAHPDLESNSLEDEIGRIRLTLQRDRLSPQASQSLFLQSVSRLALYGVELHPVKSIAFSSDPTDDSTINRRWTVVQRLRNSLSLPRRLRTSRQRRSHSQSTTTSTITSTARPVPIAPNHQGQIIASTDPPCTTNATRSSSSHFQHRVGLHCSGLLLYRGLVRIGRFHWSRLVKIQPPSSLNPTSVVLLLTPIEDDSLLERVLQSEASYQGDSLANPPSSSSRAVLRRHRTSTRHVCRLDFSSYDLALRFYDSCKQSQLFFTSLESDGSSEFYSSTSASNDIELLSETAPTDDLCHRYVTTTTTNESAYSLDDDADNLRMTRRWWLRPRWFSSLSSSSQESLPAYGTLRRIHISLSCLTPSSRNRPAAVDDGELLTTGLPIESRPMLSIEQGHSFLFPLRGSDDDDVTSANELVNSPTTTSATVLQSSREDVLLESNALVLTLPSPPSLSTAIGDIVSSVAELASLRQSPTSLDDDDDERLDLIDQTIDNIGGRHQQTSIRSMPQFIEHSPSPFNSDQSDTSASVVTLEGRFRQPYYSPPPPPFRPRRPDNPPPPYRSSITFNQCGASSTSMCCAFGPPSFSSSARAMLTTTADTSQINSPTQSLQPPTSPMHSNHKNRHTTNTNWLPGTRPVDRQPPCVPFDCSQYLSAIIPTRSVLFAPVNNNSSMASSPPPLDADVDDLGGGEVMTRPSSSSIVAVTVTLSRNTSNASSACSCHQSSANQLPIVRTQSFRFQPITCDDINVYGLCKKTANIRTVIGLDQLPIVKTKVVSIQA